MRTVLLVLVVVSAVACKPRAYECSVDMECTASNGGFGRCLAGAATGTGPKYCAFVDTNCASGFRFDDTAGDYAEDCVDPGALATPDAGVPDGGGGMSDGAPVMIDGAPVMIDGAPMGTPDATPMP